MNENMKMLFWANSNARQSFMPPPLLTGTQKLKEYIPRQIQQQPILPLKPHRTDDTEIRIKINNQKYHTRIASNRG